MQIVKFPYKSEVNFSATFDFCVTKLYGEHSAIGCSRMNFMCMMVKFIDFHPQTYLWAISHYQCNLMVKFIN